MMVVIEAEAHFASGQWEQALEEYSQILERHPGDIPACRRLVDLYAIRGRLHDALNAQLQLVEALRSAGELEEALTAVDSAIGLQPENDRARLRKIAILQQAGCPEEAVRQSRELSRLYLALNQGDRSIALLLEIQKSAPENLDVGLELAETYVSQGHIAQAADHYRRVGWAYQAQGNPERAAEAFRRLSLVTPDDPELMLTLGQLCAQLGRFHEAEQEFRRVLRQDLNHLPALFCLGRVCRWKGQNRDAVLAFNRVLQLDPDEVEAHEHLAEIYRAMGQNGEALARYLSAGQGYRDAGQRELSVRMFQLALGLDSANPTACCELVQAGAPLEALSWQEPSALPVPALPGPVARPSGGLTPRPVQGKSHIPCKPVRSQAVSGKLAKPAPKPVLIREAPAPEPAVLEPVVVPPWEPVEVSIQAETLTVELPPPPGEPDWLAEPVALQEELFANLPTASETWYGGGERPPSRLPPEHGDPYTYEESQEEPLAECPPAVAEEPARVDLARELRQLQPTTEAAALFRAYREALATNPAHPAVGLDLADLYLRYGLLEDAVTLYRELIQASPESVDLRRRLVEAHLWNEQPGQAADALLELAGLHESREEKSEALHALQTVLSLEPYHVQARRSLLARCQEPALARYHLSQLAEAALTRGDLEESAQAFRRLLEQAEDPRWRERLAQVYEAQGDVPGALRELARVQACQREAQQWTAAAFTGERILRLDPDHRAVRRELAELYRQLQRPVERLAHLVQLADQDESLLLEILAEDPEQHSARARLVDGWLSQGEVERALPHCETLARHYLETREPSLASELYRRLVALRPQDRALRHELIGICRHSGNQSLQVEQWRELATGAEAAQAYQALLELGQNCHLELARALAAQGRVVAALQAYRAARATRPEATGELLTYLLEQRRAPELVALLRELPERHSEVLQEASRLEGYFHGELLFHLGHLDLAIEQLQQSRRDPIFAHRSYHLLGECFAAKPGYNMLDLAERQLRKGLALPGGLDSDYQALHYSLGQLYLRQDRSAEALRELRECYELDIAYRDVADHIARLEARLTKI